MAPSGRPRNIPTYSSSTKYRDGAGIAPVIFSAGGLYQIPDLPPLVQRFNVLVREWRDATMNMSSLNDMVAHPAYLRIIGLGQPVVPLLIDELEREPDHWFTALSAITGANPVDEDETGDLDRMTNAWIEWAEAHGYR